MIIEIILLYIAPTVLTVVGLYYVVSSEKGTVGEFLGLLPYALIPLINIIFALVVIVSVIEGYLKKIKWLMKLLNKEL